MKQEPKQPYERYWRARLAVKKGILTEREGNFLTTFFNLKDPYTAKQLGRILADPDSFAGGENNAVP